MDQTTGATPNKVVPLLSALSRAEDLISALAIRLEPITNHAVQAASTSDVPHVTVTSRISQLGDTLQYYLDNIEL